MSNGKASNSSDSDHASDKEVALDTEKISATADPAVLPKLHHLAGGEVDDPTLPIADNVSFDRSKIPLRYRLIAFSMILFFATGSSFCENTLGPLKSTLIKQLNVNNAQYGAISSASALVNTILPIIGGIGMDYWGATYAALISSVFIVVGAVISASSANTGHYGLLIGGRILMGFGSTVIESTQNKLYAHWFHGSGLAFIFAVDIAWGRIVTIICRSTAVPMSLINGWWGWALWIPMITTAFNLALVIGYWAYERSVPREFRPALGKDARGREGWSKRRIGLDTIRQLPRAFLLLTVTQIPQNAVISVYTSNLADMQTRTRGTSTLAAGYNSSIQGVIPIISTPLVGLFFDKVGWRMPFVSITAMLYIVVFALIGLTKVHPLGPILLSSFALSSNAITFIASIPILVNNDALLGTAFGVWKAFANANSILLDVVAGAIQDLSPTSSYDAVIYMLIGIKVVQVFLGPTYDYFDGRWLGHALRKSEAKRVAIRKEAQEQGTEALYGWRVSRKVIYSVAGMLGAMIVTSWVIYIVYSLGT